MSFPAEGGCLCGKVRYRVSAESTLVNYCHCANCRKASGAPVLVWAGFKNEDFEWLGEEPARYRYESEHYPAPVERLFCASCGSHLVLKCEAFEGEVDVTAGSLDDPELARPELHLFARGQLSWLHLADDLPRHETRKTS